MGAGSNGEKSDEAKRQGGREAGKQRSREERSATAFTAETRRAQSTVTAPISDCMCEKHLEELEDYLYRDAGGYWFAGGIVSWSEAPSADGFESFLVEAETGRIQDFD